MSKERLIFGADEAGRGPVIGSLFIAGVVFKESDLPKLEKEGVTDSKLLKHPKRIELSKKIIKLAKSWKIIQVTPQEVDKAVESEREMNLNWLEAHKLAELINTLKPDIAYIDCPSPNIKAFTNYLLKLLDNKNIELQVHHKADFKFRIVGAASILAKCAREDEIEMLKKKYGEIGPGYTSNEITQKFIKENFEKYPEIFRKSWMTFKNQKEAKIQKKLDQF